MKSIITDEEIPEDVVYRWDIQGTLSYNDYDECNFCRKRTQELFELRDPMGTGFFAICHSCLLNLGNYVRSKWDKSDNEDICPICQCSVTTISNIYECKFGHKWRVEKYKRRKVVK